MTQRANLNLSTRYNLGFINTNAKKKLSLQEKGFIIKNIYTLLFLQCSAVQCTWCSTVHNSYVL